MNHAGKSYQRGTVAEFGPDEATLPHIRVPDLVGSSQGRCDTSNAAALVAVHRYSACKPIPRSSGVGCKAGPPVTGVSTVQIRRWRSALVLAKV